MAEQRFACNCGSSWTGMQMEHCRVCHETFNNTRAGDKHRTVASVYAITNNKGKVLSEHNERRRCLTPAEMQDKGMSQEKNGSWNSGGNWSPDIYKEK